MGSPIYLSTKIWSLTASNGKKIWTQGSSSYIQEATMNVKEWLEAPDPLQYSHVTDYCPELDTSLELDAEMVNWYQSAIGILQWAVELGCINITTETSVLASHMALPQNAILCIFSYLKKHHNSWIAFNPTVPDLDHNQFPRQDWMCFYGSMKEPICQMPQNHWDYQ